jgi:hypothetical protein
VKELFGFADEFEDIGMPILELFERMMDASEETVSVKLDEVMNQFMKMFYLHMKIEGHVRELKDDHFY